VGTLGPNGGGVFTDDATIGVVGLSNPDNAGADDGSFVTWALLLGQGGHYLKGTDFRFAIPLDAIILGIRVTVKRRSTVNLGMLDLSVRLVKADTIQGDDKGSPSAWLSTEEEISYGAADDLWGLSWTPTEINDGTFGLSIAPTAAVIATAEVNYVSVLIDYQGSNRALTGWRRLQTSGLSTVDRLN